MIGYPLPTCPYHLPGKLSAPGSRAKPSPALHPRVLSRYGLHQRGNSDYGYLKMYTERGVQIAEKVSHQLARGSWVAVRLQWCP